MIFFSVVLRVTELEVISLKVTAQFIFPFSESLQDSGSGHKETQPWNLEAQIHITENK